MVFRSFFRSILLSLLALLLAGAYPTAADSSHARIIRLSLVQGDVRFTRDTHGDSLTDQKAVWETAVLNLPIRQGYVVATDNGRAEVEFENGAMAFLNENTVLEFYDLSLDNGARTTRLVLRQGTASFYVNPASDDYFSVTGGDFTVEASGRTSFRMDNFDDGSNVDVLKGYVNVRHKDNTTPLEKGQSLTMRTDDASSVNIGRLPENDDFDHWVAGREDSVVTATTAAMQYTSSPYYSSGFGDLYTYGSWYPVAGYGNCWRPYGVGLGWSPFDYGNWYFDPFIGWSFIGYQPWGWLPYHFGGWIFEPGFGWVWAPTGFGVWNRRVPWRPVTAVWVHSGGTLGLVPAHPLDVRGRKPLNLGQGVMPVSGGGASVSAAGNSSANWKVLKQPSREALVSSVAASPPPARLSRTVLAGNTASRVVTLKKDSSIAYDPHEHRFVNNNALPPETRTENRPADGHAEKAGVSTATATRVPGASASERAGISAATVTRVPGAATVPERAGISTATVPRPPRNMTPPSPPRASGFGGDRGGSSAGSSRWSASGRSSAPSAPASHPAPAPSGHPH
jgi:FecR protein